MRFDREARWLIFVTLCVLLVLVPMLSGFLSRMWPRWFA